MKRLSTMALAVALLLVVGAAPALADRPVVTTDSNTFPAPNPCTGEIHTLTIDAVIKSHFHQNNILPTVFTTKRTGTTTDGFVMMKGTPETSVNNGHVLSYGFVDRWRNEASGEMFRVQYRLLINFNTGNTQVEGFSAVCLGS